MPEDKKDLDSTQLKILGDIRGAMALVTIASENWCQAFDAEKMDDCNIYVGDLNYAVERIYNSQNDLIAYNLNKVKINADRS